MTVSIGNEGERKKVPTSEADLADQWKTMLAYTGKYWVEGNDLVTKVDVAWYELWNGTEQRRHFELEGDTLTIVTALARRPWSHTRLSGSARTSG